MERRNRALLIFGTVLLAIGLLASFYQVTLRVGQPPGVVLYQIVAPYQGVGIVLLVSGIILIALGFLHLTASEKMVERSRPVGIVVICFLTLFASVLYGFFGAMSIGVWALTGGATGEGNASLVLLVALPFL